MSSDWIEVSSGYKFYANGGFVSINDKLETAQGWDGGFTTAQYESDYDPEYPGPSKQEKLCGLSFVTTWRQ